MTRARLPRVASPAFHMPLEKNRHVPHTTSTFHLTPGRPMTGGVVRLRIQGEIRAHTGHWVHVGKALKNWIKRNPF
jgi:hypothetical protein